MRRGPSRVLSKAIRKPTLMGIKFQCPACQAVRAANERLMGREIKCPECGSSVQLPTREQMEQAKQQRDALKLERQKEKERELQLSRMLAQAAVPQPSWNAYHDSAAGEDASEEDMEEAEERISAEEKALAAATANFLRPRPPQGEDMDMTPMVDVTFLLLIFFMITASFSVQKAIQRPAQRNDQPSQNAVVAEKDTVTVQVDEFNAYNIITANGDSPAGSKQDLIIALNAAFEGGGTGVQPSKLVIEAHENCIHAAVVAALDAGREAKFESFEVTTVEQFD